MIREISVPIVVDAGLGKALRCLPVHGDGVRGRGWSNTAIAVSRNPVEFARAFSMAVRAGRLAWRSGLPESAVGARASSPLTGFLRDTE
jgi:thiazole synthase